MLLYYIPIWNILQPRDISYGLWYNLWAFGIFFPRFGKFYKEKSGNPAASAFQTQPQPTLHEKGTSIKIKLIGIIDSKGQSTNLPSM
jgi:hypothetical protein